MKRIYKEYLNGKGPNRIAKELEDDNVPNWNGKAKWYPSTIKKMLMNEKYKGDALLQKTYTVDFLSKKRVENNGEVPQYYVEESHPAIIDKEMWEAVQLEMERRKEFAIKHGINKIDYTTADNPFAGKVICGECGSVFGRKVWNSNDENLRRVVWRCNRKYEVKGKKSCENGHVDDGVLYEAFVDGFNTIIGNKEYFMEKWREQGETEDALVRYKSKDFIKIFKSAKYVEGFDGDLFFRIVEKMTVFEEGRIVVSLLGGEDVVSERLKNRKVIKLNNKQNSKLINVKL